MEDSMAKKKTMGRQKIEMKKIENKSHLKVAFCKRRSGLFKKAAELSRLTGAEIAILVESPARKSVHSFGIPSADTVVDRYLRRRDAAPTRAASDAEDARTKYWEAVERLGTGEEKEKVRFWWNKPIDNLGLRELEEFRDALLALKNKLNMARANEMATATAMASTTPVRRREASPSSDVCTDGEAFSLLLSPRCQYYY